MPKNQKVSDIWNFMSCRYINGFLFWSLKKKKKFCGPFPLSAPVVLCTKHKYMRLCPLSKFIFHQYGNDHMVHLEIEECNDDFMFWTVTNVYIASN